MTNSGHYGLVYFDNNKKIFFLLVKPFPLMTSNEHYGQVYLVTKEIFYDSSIVYFLDKTFLSSPKVGAIDLIIVNKTL